MDTNNFPRKSGRCAVHTIPETVIKGDHGNWEEIFNETSLNIALSYLKQNDAELAKGDLICFLCINGYRNDGIAIYDGQKIIELDYEIDDYGSLPNIFQVISGGVPVNYWHQYDNNDIHCYISHNTIVWLNLDSILPNSGMSMRDLCLGSICWEQMGDKFCISASFGKYKIILDTEVDENPEGKIKLLRELGEILKDSEPLLQLQCDSAYFENTQNCLFLTKDD
jgi:hypothetical protein